MNLQDIKNDRSLSALYFFPKQLSPHRSMFLPGVAKPARQLTGEDLARRGRGHGRGGGMDRGGRGRGGYQNGSYNNGHGYGSTQSQTATSYVSSYTTQSRTPYTQGPQQGFGGYGSNGRPPIQNYGNNYGQARGGPPPRGAPPSRGMPPNRGGPPRGGPPRGGPPRGGSSGYGGSTSYTQSTHQPAYGRGGYSGGYGGGSGGYGGQANSGYGGYGGYGGQASRGGYSGSGGQDNNGSYMGYGNQNGGQARGGYGGGYNGGGYQNPSRGRGRGF
ncbi:hypothetical protein BDR05DRAFT_566872 [Suillus weaverae]|nr:hypothetical protein BDR05DRAFT_566872 [Suillus weaverae]